MGGAEKDRMRGTGGNRFIGPDATRGDLLASINDQLGDLQEWADETGRLLDLSEVTISTKRIPSGNISVSVTADLAPDSAYVPPPAQGRACRTCGYGPDLCDESGCPGAPIPPGTAGGEQA